MTNELLLKHEASRCILCYDAPCTGACKNGKDPARAIRSIRFMNNNMASDILKDCKYCDGECEKKCLHYDRPIRIREIAFSLDKPKNAEYKDLSVDFCGVKCENPFFLSSSIVAGTYEMCANALRMGWAGVVYKTVGFLIPTEVSPRFDEIGKEGTSFIGFKNLEQISDHPLEENLEAFRRLKKEFPAKVLIVSIMGRNEQEWTDLAKLVTEAGADIIECNFSCPHMSGEGLGSDVGQNPEIVEKYTKATKKGTNVPVIAKMTPNISHIEIPAIAAVKAGADGLAAINTIKCITGIDTDSYVSYPDVSGKCSVSGYSGKAVKPIALRYISDIAKSKELSGIPLSGIGGIENWHDALEFILAGCSNIQITTAVMQYGYRIIDDLIYGMQFYMSEHNVNSISELVGKALNNIVNADELDRNTCVFPKINKEKCIGCGRCYISCRDAGHQAIIFNVNTHIVSLAAKKCVGCHLCRLVCPTGAISSLKRVKKP